MPKIWANALRAWSVALLVTMVMILVGCAGGHAFTPLVANPNPPVASNLNLIFVVSEDLNFNAPGDVDPATANLTNSGLERALMTDTFLYQYVMGSQNVAGIYALEPMTHLQTPGKLPDMAGLEAVQQFSVLNQITLSSNTSNGDPYTGQNSPVNASYSAASLPLHAYTPSPYCPTCQGIDFNDAGGGNETLVSEVVQAGSPGFYVFSAPWETMSAMLAKINALEGYHLKLPLSYGGANELYVISITPSGTASFIPYNSNVVPPTTYPVLPSAGLVPAACTVNTPPSLQINVGENGAILPSGINTNETVYFVRHADAHPYNDWSDNNYVGAGQWRTLDLPNSLRGKVHPDQVWSGDPSQYGEGTVSANGDFNWSGLAPAMTVEPYAIANDLPYHLQTTVNWTAANPGPDTSQFFFTGGQFTNHKLLFGYAYVQIGQTVNALLASYFPGSNNPPTAPVWSPYDYDSLWILTLDAKGNLTADFSQCQGISSGSLPPTPPAF
jgi:hypothetical protein